jgi:hypothetical protein
MGRAVEISGLPRIRQRPSNRTFTGWLEVTGDGAVVYPPTSNGLRGAAAQETTAGIQRAVREVGHVAGSPPENR